MQYLNPSIVIVKLSRALPSLIHARSNKIDKFKQVTFYFSNFLIQETIQALSDSFPTHNRLEPLTIF